MLELTCNGIFIHLSLKYTVEHYYCNDPKVSDRQVLANSVDPDQTAPDAKVWSGCALFAISSASFGHISLWF